MSDTELHPVVDKIQELKHIKNNRLDDSLFSKDLAPHYMKLAGQLSTSDLVPKCFRGKPQDLFLCWSMGYQVGLTPEQSMQCIAVINGKPAMWGDDMLALCMSHRDFEDIIENPIVKNDTVIGYNCTVKRKGKADKESIFTLDMAKKAGLLAKGGVWSQYPERMLKLRARGFCLRDAFPDALKGIKPREEVEDYIDGDFTVSQQKVSRTESLKQDITTKQGASNAGMAYGSVATAEYKITVEENAQDKQHLQEDKICKEITELHTEIKELIATKQFPEERLQKALKYYEVTKIEELSYDSALDFILNLTKS